MDCYLSCTYSCHVELGLVRLGIDKPTTDYTLVVYSAYGHGT
jgi:hypothetical protein